VFISNTFRKNWGVNATAEEIAARPGNLGSARSSASEILQICQGSFHTITHAVPISLGKLTDASKDA